MAMRAERSCRARDRAAASARTSLLLLATAGVLGLALAESHAARADTLRVTRTDDPAPNGCSPRNCSLREAVIAANRAAGRDEIVLRSGKTYELARPDPRENRARAGDLDFTGDLSVRPGGKRRATIDGTALEYIFSSRSRDGRARFARVRLIGGDDGTVYSYGELTLHRASVGDSGGIGIRAGGPVNLVRSTVAGNESIGVHSYLPALVERSKITGNGYGGIYVCRKLTMTDSLVRGNIGGWMMAAVQLGDYDSSSPSCEHTPPYEILNSRIVGNPAGGDGSGAGVAGGRYNYGGLIRDSIIARNSGDRGGVQADGVRILDSRIAGNLNTSDDGAGGVTGAGVRVVRSTVADNTGRIGGLYLNDSRVRASTIVGNHARRNGGGIDVGDETAITNSTIANNKADMNGGGIYANFGLVLRSSTVAYNEADADGVGGESGGGIIARSDAKGDDFTVINSLIALNTTGPADAAQDCAGPFDIAHHNLLSVLDATCDGFGAPSNLVDPEPHIGQLAANGGPTETIALRRLSPAIGAAARGSTPPRDQRGVTRDRRPDIGAFERR